MTTSQPPDPGFRVDQPVAVVADTDSPRSSPAASDIAASDIAADDREDLVGRLRVAGCVFAEEEAVLLYGAASDAAERDAWCRRREAGEPLEQIVGWVEFDGTRYVLGPGVFVPRRRSEFLVERAVAAMRGQPQRLLTLVEMCCGIGAIGLATIRRLVAEGFEVHAHLADVDAAAVHWARRNVAREPEPARPRVHHGDLWSAVPTTLVGHVDLLVANAPYVPTDELAFLPAEARDHEPGTALDGGPDGLGLHRRIAAATAAWLRPGGCAVIETSRRQADLTAGLLSDAGLDVRIDHDPGRDATAVTGRRDERSPGAPG